MISRDGVWMKVSEKIWWTKLAAAVGVAIVTLVLQVFFNLRGTTAFMLGVIIGREDAWTEDRHGRLPLHMDNVVGSLLHHRPDDGLGNFFHV
jgi:hypothetical protein